MTCPDCQSKNAVSKSEAWDALTNIPPAVQHELGRLRIIEESALTLLRRTAAEERQAVQRYVDEEALMLLAECLGSRDLLK